MIPVTDELIQDGISSDAVVGFMRESLVFMGAVRSGEAIYRGGGWWRVRGETFRGRAAAKRAVMGVGR